MRKQNPAAWHEVFGSWQSVLAILAIGGTAAWFLVTRPDAPKIKIEQQVTAFPAGGDNVLLLSEITITNVGVANLRLDRQPYRYFIQRVTPLPPSVAGELNLRNPDQTLQVAEGDIWSALASRNGEVTSDIRSEETENIYLRVVLACQPDLRIYSTVWFDRPIDEWVTWVRSFWPGFHKDAGTVSWIKQTPVDLTQACQARKERQ